METVLKPSCPDETQLVRLLNASDADSPDESIVDHLGECEDCQSRLEALAVGKTNFSFWETAIKSDVVWPARKPKTDPNESKFPVIPGYRILSVVGKGGMGIVYKAYQENLNRLVALKRMRTNWLKEQEYADRFEEEAKAIGRLKHPNLVQIYDVFEHRGDRYLVLEYVEGGTLADKLKNETLPINTAASLIMNVAKAIGFSHQKGILHRDLKPANLLLTNTDPQPSFDGVVHDNTTLGEIRAAGTESNSSIPNKSLPEIKVTDFGLARQIEEPKNWTKTGEVMGTPSYMSPEQARGDKTWSQPSADIYALGSVLYETLTGRPPFRGESAVATINQLISEEPIRPSIISRSIPRDLETICLKCLNKKTTDRYSTAFELADDLQRFLDGKPIVAKRQPFWIHATKWATRQPVSATLVVSFVVATTVFLVFWFRFTMDLQSLNGDLVDQTRIARWENLQARKAAVEANEKLEEAVRTLTTQANLLRDMPELESPAMRPLRNKLIKQTLDSYQSLAAELNRAGKVPMEGDTYARISQLYRELGELERSMSLLEQAIEIRRNGKHSFNYDPKFDSSLAVFLIDYGSALSDQGNQDLAESSINESIGILAQPNLNPPMSESSRLYRLAAAQRTLTKVLFKFPKRRNELKQTLLDSAATITAAINSMDTDSATDSMQYLMAVAIYRNLGTFWEQEKEIEKANLAFAEAVEYGAILLTDNPQNGLYQHTLATALCNLASSEKRLGNVKEGLQAFNSAKEIRSGLAQDAPYDARHLHELAKIGMAIGDLHKKEMDDAAALDSYLEAARHYSELSTRFPGEKSYVNSLVGTLVKCLPLADKGNSDWTETLQIAKSRILPWLERDPMIKEKATSVLEQMSQLSNKDEQ